MSVQENTAQGSATTILEKNNAVAQGVYASLFEKINLSPVSSLTGLDAFQNNDAMADATTDERVTAAVSVFLDLLKQSAKKWKSWIKPCWMATLRHWMTKLVAS